MKKLLTVSILVIAILLLACTSVKATTQSELEEYLLSTFTIAGQSVSLTASDKVKVERYFSQYTLTDEQATAIKAKIDEGIALMDAAGVSDPNKLSSSKKTELLNIAKDAASLAGLTLTYNSSNNSIEIYKDGVLIETTSTTTKLVQTGSSNILAISLTGVAIIAVAAIVAVKKVRANAQ